MLRSPNKVRQERDEQQQRQRRVAPIERELPISDPTGHQRYLGRPPYFGPLDPDSLETMFAARRSLERAQARGPRELQGALATYGLTSLEQWWHIEASFYQRHMINTESRSRVERSPKRRRQRTPHGTPMPELVSPSPSPSPSSSPSPCSPRRQPRAQTVTCVIEEPVPFEVFCEIAGAQAAWSGAGLDPTVEASRHFLLDPHELLAVEVYWAAELAKSRELARHFARRMLEYKEMFSDG